MSKYVCAICGSTDIQVRTWVGANDNTIHEWVDDENCRECWCEECQDIAQWKMIED